MKVKQERAGTRGRHKDASKNGQAQGQAHGAGTRPAPTEEKVSGGVGRGGIDPLPSGEGALPAFRAADVAIEFGVVLAKPGTGAENSTLAVTFSEGKREDILWLERFGAVLEKLDQPLRASLDQRGVVFQV